MPAFGLQHDDSSPTATSLVSAQARNCNDCAPARNNRNNPAGTYRVVFGPEFTDTNLNNAILSGVSDYYSDGTGYMRINPRSNRSRQFE